MGESKRIISILLSKKMQRKLAGRATLVQSVSSTIPNYTMQVHKLSASICKEVDRVNRNFLWGETMEKKKVHLMKWQKVCTPKMMGGLGIRNCGDNNKAMVSKIKWRVMNEEEPIWIKTLKREYKPDSNLRLWCTKRKASPIWRNLLYGKDSLV